MATATPDPQAEGDLQQIVRQLADDFQARNTLYAEIDKVVYLDKPVSIPEAYAEAALEVRAPAALNVVNTVTAALSINPPVVQFRPTSMGLSGERNATLRNHYFEGSWRRQEEEAGRRIFRAAMHACCTYGEGVIKTVERTKTAWAQYGSYQRNLAAQLAAEVEAGSMDSDSAVRVQNAKTEEYKRGLSYPITSIDVHPQQFTYVKGTTGFTLCIERSRIPYYDAYAKFRAGINDKGQIMPEAAALSQLEWQRRLGGQTSLELTEVWDLDYAYYMLRGPGDNADRVVKKLKHGYGNRATGSLRGPYFHSFGLTTSARLPERMGLGLVFGYLKVFGLLDSLLTIMGQAAYQGGWSTFGRKMPAGGGLGVADPGTSGLGPDSTEQSEVIKFEPGMIYPYELVTVEPPAITANVDKMLGEVQGILKQALPDVVQGVMQGGDSGYAINQATHLARLIWDPIVDNMETMLAQRVGFESWLIENKVRETCYVWGDLPDFGGKRKADNGWLAIGPDDLNGQHRYQVRLDPETPSNEVIDLRVHAQKLQLGLEDVTDAIEAVGGDPDEVEIKRLVTTLKADPEIMGRVRDATLTRLGIIQQKRLDDASGQLDAATGQWNGPPPPGEIDGAPALGGVGSPQQPGQNMAMEPAPGGGLGPAPAGMPGGLPSTGPALAGRAGGA